MKAARGFMFSLGCIQALKCNKNTYPTGIATHDPRFQKGLVAEDKFEKVASYAKQLTKEAETVAHSIRVSEPRQLTQSHVRIVDDKEQSVSMKDLYG